MKRTNQPSKKKRKGKNGFLKRMQNHYSVIIARRKKGRHKLTV